MILRNILYSPEDRRHRENQSLVLAFLQIKSIYIFTQNVLIRGRTKNVFSSVTRKSEQNIRRIFRVSQDKENYIMDKNGT